MWGILCVYITKKGKLIYKFLKLDNNIYVNDYNVYEHKLIYKAKIKGTELKDLTCKKDFYEIIKNKKRLDVKI